MLLIFLVFLFCPLSQGPKNGPCHDKKVTFSGPGFFSGEKEKRTRLSLCRGVYHKVKHNGPRCCMVDMEKAL